MKRTLCFFWILIAFSGGAFSQRVIKKMDLQDVIVLAKDQSPDAMLAKHRFRASYWEFRSFRADFLPFLNFNGTLPSYDNAISSNTGPDGAETFIRKNVMNNFGELSLNQKIGLTGGEIFIRSELQRKDDFDRDTAFFNSNPLNIGLRQPISSYNELKWDKRIEPLKYEEARKTYIRAMEDVSVKAVNYFFDLALAQQNKQIAEINYHNTDTLYKIGKGRYNIGTIAENELLQLELQVLNAETALNNATIDLEMKKFRLRSFLGYNENVDIELTVPHEIPALQVEVDKALLEARKNNPEILSFDIQLLEAQRDVRKAKAERGLQADLFLTYGLSKNAGEFNDVYREPDYSSTINMGISIPLVDWGVRKGQYLMAQSRSEVVKTNVEQAQIDFEQDVMLKIMQFNLQDDQVGIAAKADTIAQNRYEVTKQRFLIGKIDVLDLNVSMKEMDDAKRAYISTVHNYWQYYYSIRRLTLYNFLDNTSITADFEELIR